MSDTSASAPPAEPLLVGARDAARLLAISERTLWGLTKSGALKSIKIGRAVRYDRRDLIAFVDRQKQG